MSDRSIFRSCLLSLAVIVASTGNVDAQLGGYRLVLAAGGGSYDGRGFTDMRVTATVGEPIVGSAVGNSLGITAGFQQPDIDGIVPVVEVSDVDYRISAYPNPTVDQLSVELGDAARQVERLELYDLLGHRMRTSDVTASTPTVIFQGLGNLPSGTYLLTLVEKNGRRASLGRIQLVRE